MAEYAPDVSFRCSDDHYKRAFVSAVCPEHVYRFAMFRHSIAESLHRYALWQLVVDPIHVLAISDNLAAALC